SARYLKFKRKHGKQSSYHCSSISAGDNWIKVPKDCRFLPVEACVNPATHRLQPKKLEALPDRTGSSHYA
ncbi:MAG: hypothetical protein MI864_22235, partial [Pseudomonadales bacterium]|nr:hypothetical protein [Pseudomonadales bacterium]